LKEVSVVTSFLLRRSGEGEQVLLLKRSGRVGTYRGKWSAVSGYLERESPLEQALLEIEEETGLRREDVRPISQGQPLQVLDEELGVRWTVHPFLFEALKPEAVRLDWENVEVRWVDPEEVRKADTVPGLAEALDRVLSHR
jgi:8-oxo-dGTP pyrophosphatase MutT (NUDIX family)